MISRQKKSHKRNKQYSLGQPVSNSTSWTPMFIRGEFFHMVSVWEKESDWTNKPEINRQCSPRPASNRRGGTHLRKPWENIYTISFSRKGLPALNKQTGNKQAMLSQPSNSSLRYKFTFDFYANSLKKHNRHTLYLNPFNRKSWKSRMYICCCCCTWTVLNAA